jgi:deoxyribonuclease-4
MKIGIHVRVAGGYAKAIEHAKAAGCTAIQIFSSNPRSYRPSKPDAPALENFAAMRREAGIDPCVIHTPYLINLASDDPKVYLGSLGLLKADLATAAIGKIKYVNTHLGSYGTRDRKEGFVAICRALEDVLAEIEPGVELVLENSAGAGNLAGGTLDELGEFVKTVGHPQMGICLDTAHAWAAGYRLDTKAAVRAFFDEVEEKIGIEAVRMFHFNDTEVPLGGARDRHFHIGDGNIGFEGFRAILATPEIADKTAILETPGEDADDIRNMNTILSIQRALRQAQGDS